MKLQTEIATLPTSDAWLQDLSAQAHHEATVKTVPVMATQLQASLGQRTVAYMLGMGDPKALGRWARGERAPHLGSEQRLRGAYQIFRLLALADAEETARAWFIGMNPHLGDRAPFAILGEEPEHAAKVLAAAKAFVVGN
jgi:hypothetical protein